MKELDEIDSLNKEAQRIMQGERSRATGMKERLESHKSRALSPVKS